MKFSKFAFLFFFLFIADLAWFLSQLESLTIFQYMLGVQIVPSVLLALAIGRLAADSSKWLSFILILFGSALFAFFLYQVMLMTPQSTIEQNTVQSSQSVYTFNREISIGTYIGFFLQELLLASAVRLMIRLFRKLAVSLSQ